MQTFTYSCSGWHFTTTGRRNDSPSWNLVDLATVFLRDPCNRERVLIDYCTAKEVIIFVIRPVLVSVIGSTYIFIPGIPGPPRALSGGLIPPPYVWTTERNVVKCLLFQMRDADIQVWCHTCGPRGTIPRGGVILCIAPPIFGWPVQSNDQMEIKHISWKKERNSPPKEIQVSKYILYNNNVYLTW